ncbi:MAG: VWA domain-containing protein [Rhodospirillaceae bacterium]
MVEFLAPRYLFLLIALPLLVAAYLYLINRKKHLVLRYTSVAMVKDAADGLSSMRRHVPPLVLLIAVSLALIASARPAAMLTLPSDRAQIILAIDVSVSMRARDVEPDRITAAKNAAKTFVQEAPGNLQIGIVAFAGNAMLVQAPTFDKQSLIEAIDNFRLQRATNIGGAVMASLQTIFPGLNLQSALPAYDRRASRRTGVSLDEQPVAEEPLMPPVPPGSYTSSAVILLTDGQATTGPDPIAAARVAADRGVRIFTVGLGSPNGEIIGWGGRGMRVQIDEETLKTMADITKAKYFYATTSAVLADVYKDLNAQLVMERKRTEISFLFAGLAAILLVCAAGLSLAWSNRIF